MKTKVKLHGMLGEQVGQADWSLYVSNAGEAMHAINSLTKNKLYRQFIENDKTGIKYRVLVDGKDFSTSEPLKNDAQKAEHLFQDSENLKNSDLFIQNKFKRIDIIPVVEGADAIFQTILGILLIIVGLITQQYWLVAIGVGLVAAGVTALLMEPPEFGEIRNIESVNTASYLFNGPVNTVREGNPIPVVYGQLLAGSQVIAATYTIQDISAEAGTIST